MNIWPTTNLDQTPRLTEGDDLIFDIEYALHYGGDVRLVRRQARVAGGINLAWPELAAAFDQATRQAVAELKEGGV